MKVSKNSTVAAALVLGLLVWSCHDEDKLVTNSFAVLNPNEVLGQWEITTYSDSGIDKTALFTGFTLQFGSNEEIFVFHEDTIVNGTWNIQAVAGVDLLIIEVNSAKTPYRNLEQDWDVTEKTISTLMLSSNSPAVVEFIALRRL